MDGCRKPAPTAGRSARSPPAAQLPCPPARVPPDQVVMPSTATAGWRELPYYDPPVKKDGKARLVGRYQCVVFATVAPDGRQHAHRIYVGVGGAGKAELGVGPDGHARDPKKSAKLVAGQSAAGCAVLWGDPTSAPHLLLAEGIETAGPSRSSTGRNSRPATSRSLPALSTSGIRTFVPWPATRTVTVAADRDEARPADGDRRPNLTPCGVALAGYLLWFWSGWLGDEGRGHDCADPARVFRAGQDDQGDRPGAARLAQHGAQGAALGCHRVHLRARGPAAAEAGALEGGAGSAAGCQRGEAGA